MANRAQTASSGIQGAERRARHDVSSQKGSDLFSRVKETERKTPAPQAGQRPMDGGGPAANICM